MAVEVYRFPPLDAVAYEHTLNDPMSISRGISGTPRGSQVQPNRRLVRFVAGGIGKTGDAIGYVESLKHLLAGKLNLLQVELRPMLWWRHWAGVDFADNSVLTWTDGGTPIGWTSGGASIDWIKRETYIGGADFDGWPFLRIQNAPPGITIRPGTPVSVAGETAYVVRPATVSPFGWVKLYLTKALPSGEANIGAPEVKTFFFETLPRMIQDPRSPGTYEFNGVEVFEAEFEGGFTVLNPWS